MERLMQYVWQHRLWLPADMTTTDGRRVDVLDPGLLNTNAGPDFFNAKVRIGGRMWVGNVEIHVRASDWHRHGHHTDSAYDSVVLHVVERDDAGVTRTNGESIAQVVMPCAANFSEVYHAMVNNPVAELPCADYLPALPRVYITDWLASLAFERLFAKAARVEELAGRFSGDWGQAIYVAFARALGFSINSDAFERLALATPLRQLMRHRDSLVTIEGALFGQAGFLDNLPDDGPDADYIASLREEHAFVSHKYGLARPVSPAWRMGRMRPQNFPYRRVATLAAMISHNFEIGYKLLHVSNIDEARALFDLELSGYWARRFNFGPESSRSAKAFSAASVNTLIINVVAPTLHAYGTATGRDELCHRAVDILESLPPEDNSIVRLFASAGVAAPDAFASQALIELRRSYCQPRKCLYCRIGHRYLAEKAIRR
ncbi:MAG: DUF2851 family protein [Muribaculaceae bacterium]|nr:DUF2851 family protein [Muribaculaceae bacterium]